MIKLTELLLSEGPAEYPSNHQPGMRVTKGGSMCANCKWWVAEGNKCNNQYWLKWHDGDEKIPNAADEYCCNWWQPKNK
jgi:hypothetical protein